MARLRAGITVRRLMIVVAAIALILGGFDAIFLRPFRVHQRWYGRVEADLESLAHRRPPDVSRQEWGYVVGWTLNAHANCCSHPNFVDRSQTERFADEFERKLRGRVGMETIDWVWDEFMRFSRIKSYERYRPTSPDRLKAAANESWAGIEVE